MKAHLLDEVALRAISPTALRAYLLYEGWRRLEPYGQYSEVYLNAAKGDKNEILVPVSADIADYASAISQIIRVVSSVENRDELTIYADLTRADRDVIRIRAPDADDDGSIIIDNGVEIVHRSRDMLAPGACAAIETRRAYHLGIRRSSTARARKAPMIVISNPAKKRFLPQRASANIPLGDHLCQFISVSA
jgi:hypothetical protein